MNKRLLMATAAGVVLGTGAFAQSPNTTSQNSQAQNPPAAQGQTSGTPTTPAPSASSQPSTPAPNNSAQTTTSPTGTSTTAGQSTAPNANGSNTTSQGQASGSAPSQAQSASPPAAQNQTSNPAPSNNQAQQTPAAGSNLGTAAQQPSAQSNTAQSSQTNVNASVNINDQQRTRISQSVARLNVQPLTNVNFSLSIGTAVPRDVRLSPLPADIVEVVPQFRGYNFVVVREEIVIVDPSSYQIVAVLPASGRSTAGAPAPREQSKVKFSDRDREAIRKHVRARPVEGRTSERRTTGSATRTEIRVGERVPDSVEIEAFPETVYRESPGLREYRYIHRDSRTYVVDPRERQIIEEID